MRLVSTAEEIRDNVLTLEAYRHSPAEAEEYVALMGRGACFVVWETPSGPRFCPSRFAGYAGNDLVRHADNAGRDGGKTNEAISKVLGELQSDPELLEALEAFCHSLGVKPAARSHRFWRLSAAVGPGGGDVAPPDSIDGVLGAEVRDTARLQLVLSRVGQGDFRRRLVNYWGRCAVTGCACIPLLRASHVKPWCCSSDVERLDTFNGLLLVPNLDAAFDGGLVTFTDTGRMRVSGTLGGGTRKLLGIDPGMQARLERRHQDYMAFHREQVFLG